MEKIGIYEDILNQIRNLDTDELSYNTDNDLQVREIEKQKVYLWIRILLKDVVEDLQTGDDFEITYLPKKEKITSKFIAFGKKNLNRDLDNAVINYDPEDDTKILCLMVDESQLESNEIPFIRSLFKTSKYFEYQVYRRVDLEFRNTRTQQVYEYLDVDF
jgi:hypothetical protein